MSPWHKLFGGTSLLVPCLPNQAPLTLKYRTPRFQGVNPVWIILKTYALGALSLGINGSLAWHHPLGFNLITTVSLLGIAATLFLLAFAHRLNGSP